jgi:acid phosphatase family membrane protein YuiD
MGPLESLVQVLWNWVTHPVTWITATAWLTADLLKVVILKYRHGIMDWRRFFGTGGMPSSHTAFITALATCIARTEGIQSPLFGLALGVVILTSVDAAGLRRSAGLQAEVLNRIVEDLYKGKHVKPPRVKEALGHTLAEVLAGAAVGFIMVNLLYPFVRP